MKRKYKKGLLYGIKQIKKGLELKTNFNYNRDWRFV